MQTTHSNKYPQEQIKIAKKREKAEAESAAAAAKFKSVQEEEASALAGKLCLLETYPFRSHLLNHSLSWKEPVINLNTNSNSPAITEKKDKRLKKKASFGFDDVEEFKAPVRMKSKANVAEKAGSKAAGRFAGLGGGSKCEKCKKTAGFADKVKGPNNTEYHTKCFRCNKCNKQLRGGEFFENDDKPFCKVCYGRLHGPQGFRQGGGATANEARSSERLDAIGFIEEESIFARVGKK